MRIRDFLGEILATLEPGGQFHALVHYWEDFCKVYDASAELARIMPETWLVKPVTQPLPPHINYTEALMELSRLSFSDYRIINQLRLIRTFPLVTGRTRDLEECDYDETVESMFFEITPDHYTFIQLDDVWWKIIYYGLVKLNDIAKEVKEIFNRIIPDEYPKHIKRDMIGDPGNARILLYYIRRFRESSHYWLECHKHQPTVFGRIGRRKKQ